MKQQATLAALGLCLMAGSLSAAEISKEDRKRAAGLFDGVLYLKMDAPCTKGRHPYGIFLSPLVEVSPKGSNTEAGSGASFGAFHAASTVWDARVNDPMELDELDWEEDEGTVDVEIEGTGRAEGRDTVIKFIEIYSFADFEAAFQQTFSRRPLQDDHPDWPEEIRAAIGERRLLTGMTKRQAFYVVGNPAKVEKKTEDGKTIEIWTLQKKGMEFGFFAVKTGDLGAPDETLRFEDGKLIGSNVANSGQKVDLDNP